MLIAIKTQPIQELFEEGRELVMLTLDKETCKIRCAGETKEGFYDVEIIDSFNAYISGKTRIPKNTSCLPSFEQYATKKNGAEKFLKEALVLAKEERNDQWVFAELIDQEKIFHFGNHENVLIKNCYYINNEKIALEYLHLNGKEEHENTLTVLVDKTITATIIL